MNALPELWPGPFVAIPGLQVDLHPQNTAE